MSNGTNCENHPERLIAPPSLVLCAECLAEALDEVRGMEIVSQDTTLTAMLLNADEKYLVEKARAMRAYGSPFVTTCHGVLMTYDAHRELTEPRGKSDT